MIQNTLESEASQAQLATVAAKNGSTEQIERNILLLEVLDRLSADEKLVCAWRKAGVASHRGSTCRLYSTIRVIRFAFTTYF